MSYMVQILQCRMALGSISERAPIKSDDSVSLHQPDMYLQIDTIVSVYCGTHTVDISGAEARLDDEQGAPASTIMNDPKLRQYITIWRYH